jgi:hypothetical protein
MPLESQQRTEDVQEFVRLNAADISGSLCVFGDWFGRPMDNSHRVTAHESQDGYVRLTFNEGETLEVWGARGLRREGNGLIIQNAIRVRWEWYYYGRPKLPENRFFIEHRVVEGKIEATANTTWYEPRFNSSLREPAVTIR